MSSINLTGGMCMGKVLFVKRQHLKKCKYLLITEWRNCACSFNDKML